MLTSWCISYHVYSVCCGDYFDAATTTGVGSYWVCNRMQHFRKQCDTDIRCLCAAAVLLCSRSNIWSICNASAFCLPIILCKSSVTHTHTHEMVVPCRCDNQIQLKVKKQTKTANKQKKNRKNPKLFTAMTTIINNSGIINKTRAQRTAHTIALHKCRILCVCVFAREKKR